MVPLLKYIIKRVQEVFLDGDATTIRVVLAMGSLGFAVGMWLPINTFDRPAYSWMAIVASEFWWGMALFLHFAGVIWRLFDPYPRIEWAFAINLYGVLLWSFMIGCVTFALGTYSPGMAVEISLVLASWVCLLRTGLNEGKGSP